MTTHAQSGTFSGPYALPPAAPASAERVGFLGRLRTLFPKPYPPRRADYFEKAAMAREMYRL
jgi:hypothetical protein